MADTDKNKALIDCYKCSSSFLSIVKSHPLKIPDSVLEKVRSGSCLKLFLIDCRPIPTITSAESHVSVRIVQDGVLDRKEWKLWKLYVRTGAFKEYL